MGKATSKRTETVERLISLFKERGFDGASLTDLSEATGLRRASLYHHFPGGKAEMGKAALAQSGQRFARLVLAPLSTGKPPRLRLGAMLDGIEKYYGDEPPACLMNSMTLGRADNPFLPAISASVKAWMQRMTEAYADLGYIEERAADKAEQVVIAVEGSLVLARLTGDRGAFLRALDRLRADIAA